MPRYDATAANVWKACCEQLHSFLRRSFFAFEGDCRTPANDDRLDRNAGSRSDSPTYEARALDAKANSFMQHVDEALLYCVLRFFANSSAARRQRNLAQLPLAQ